MSWTGRIAITNITNIGLCGKASMGPHWQRLRRQLLQPCKGMLNHGNVCGLCLGEVGSFDDPLTEEVRARVREVVDEAFTDSSASEHEHAPLCGHRARTLVRPSQRGAETCASNR